eukprot:TRINITY_DN11012_c0_g1_i1.p1 TRINITY_DN11012_c0_g1~~TRINITY_DN11012_c0_g1_i1.p1  ORF type:complete len:747 (+),score=148.19 TRINITY_DN11012_c0_g1_i1:561-2801(+)
MASRKIAKKDEDLKEELKKTELALEAMKKENKKLNRKTKTLESSKEKLKMKHATAIARHKLEKKTTTEKLLSNLPAVPAALMKVLLKKKKKMNWTNEKEALELCLAVYFRSTSAYAVLRSSGFLLPHPSTLRRRFSTVLTQVGLCPALLEMVRLRTLALQEYEKRVTLSLDGMAVTKALSYNHNKDELVGFVNCGEYHRSDDIADQAIVLMIRGLTLKWKQVIGYFIAKHNLTTQTLQAIISDAVSALTQIGLHVDVIVMDQESSQWKWIKDRNVDLGKPYVLHDNVQSFVVPDPPHLIKNLRNNFTSKDIIFSLNGKQMTAKWSHLQAMFALDSSKPVRCVPRLTESHFTLPRGKKMKVLLACQIFSHSVAAALKLYVSNKKLPVAALETACFVETVNAMWDFVDSHSLGAPPGKKAVTRRQFEADQERFATFFNFVASWKFVANGKERKIPSHAGWMLALKSLKMLSKKLIQDEKVLSHLCLRKCNQDHVENLHSQIRGYNGFNDHPSLTSYVNALRCLACSFSTSELLDKTISAGANCQPDGEHGIHLNSDTSFAAPTPASEGPSSLGFEEQITVSATESAELPVLPDIDSDIVHYIAGSVVRNVSKLDIGCSECIGQLTTSPSEEESPSLISLKEYKLGSLVRVREPILGFFKEFESHFRKETENKLPNHNPRRTILANFKQVSRLSSDILACEHNHADELKEALLVAYCNIQIFQETKLFNQNLKKHKRGAELNKDKKLNM